MATELDYLAHIRNESARFAACLAKAAPTDHVPTCPGWTADDLLWHLTEVQCFWAAIVRDRLADPSAADDAAPDRPADKTDLLALFERATESLTEAFRTTPLDTPIWTWGADQSVKFAIRWQAHEALMHRLDAELVIADPTPIDRDLASDGIDVALTISFGTVPSWSTFTPAGSTGRIEARDTNTAWLIELGTFSGTSPNTGKVYDDDVVRVVERADAAPSFTVRGTAAELDAWLWSRGPLHPLTREGARDAFDRFEKLVAAGVP